jgi:hypothetical protein
LLLSETTFAYNQTVYEAQKKLKELGYPPGPLDGIWGRQTEFAIKIFQQDHGLPVTGRLTKETLTALGLTEVAKQSLPSSLPAIVKRISPSVVAIMTYNKAGKALKCVFRRIPSTHSEGFRPLIPNHSVHPFRRIPSTLELAENR